MPKRRFPGAGQVPLDEGPRVGFHPVAARALAAREECVGEPPRSQSVARPTAGRRPSTSSQRNGGRSRKAARPARDSEMPRTSDGDAEPSRTNRPFRARCRSIRPRRTGKISGRRWASSSTTWSPSWPRRASGSAASRRRVRRPLEVDVAPARQRVADECGLAALAGPQDRHRREAPQERPQGVPVGSIDHVSNIERETSNLQDSGSWRRPLPHEPAPFKKGEAGDATWRPRLVLGRPLRSAG